MQVLIVTIIVVAAVVFVIRSMIKSAKGHACESGKCVHAQNTSKK